MKKLLPFVAMSILAAVAIVSCKQQEGERCQITSDCEEPLVCAPATMTCESTTGTGGQIDASLPIDARIDAGVDAMVDAAPDALDASVQ